jgi:type I restriction enzyme S subunit
MSERRFLKELFQGATLVPLTLGDIGSFTYGYVAKAQERGDARFVRITDIDPAGRLIPDNPKYVDINAENEKFLLAKGDLLMARTGATFGKTMIFNEDYPAIYAGFLIKLNLDSRTVNPKYYWHFSQSNLFWEQANMLVSGGGQPQFNANALKRVTVPIPCPDDLEKSLAIQAEIVRILDNFTELTAELTAELKARKKQYNHYRGQLLNFVDADVEWKTLGDVSVKSYSGGTPKAGNPKYYEGGTIPWLRTQEVVFSDIHETSVKITQAAVDETAAKWVPANCVIIAISGATAGRSGINKIPLTTNQHCCCLEIDPEQAVYRYVFYWVSMNYEEIKGLGQGARGDLNSGIIKGFKIPIPFADNPEKSLAEQTRIVNILDKFDTLTTSLSEGLPREIKLRQRQYEYYRDLLLSFPKPEEAS